MAEKPKKIVFKRAASKEKIKFVRAKPPEKAEILREKDNAQPQPKPRYPFLSPAKNVAPAGTKGIQQNLSRHSPEPPKPRFTLNKGDKLKDRFQPIAKKTPDKGHDR